MERNRTSRISRSLFVAIAAGLATGPAWAAPAKPATPPKPKGGTMDNNAGLTQRANDDKNLVVMIHGFDDNPAMWDDMALTLKPRGVLPAGTAVWKYDWRTDASGGSTGNVAESFVNAIAGTTEQFNNLLHQIITKGRIDGAGQWKHVHIISHSLGAPINEGVARRLKQYGVETVQQTFLDPAVDREGAMARWFGNTADVAENYFATGSTLAWAGFTGHTFKSAVNVDTAATSPYDPTLFPASHHKWPVEWYDHGINGTGNVPVGVVPKSTYGRFGWGYSFERAQQVGKPWPVPDAAIHNRGRLITIGTDGKIDTSTRLSFLPEEERNPGVTVDTQTAGVTTQSTGGRVTGLDLSATGADVEYSILNVDTRSDGPIDAMSFDFAFLDSGPSARDGILSVLVAYEVEGTLEWLQVFSARQSFNLSGAATQFSEPISLWQTLADGEYAVAFAFESLDGLPTAVQVRNIEFGQYATVPTPGTLALIGAGGMIASRRRRGS